MAGTGLATGRVSIAWKLFLRLAFAVGFLVCMGAGDGAGWSVAAETWPEFRGPRGDGVVLDQSIPTQFGEGDHVTWKTTIPGRGWSSPVVADGVIWMTSAVEKVPSEDERTELLRRTGLDEKSLRGLAIAKAVELKLVAVDLVTGEMLRTLDLTTIESPDAIHSLNSYASPTPVVDGPNLYCHFGTYGTFCVDRAECVREDIDGVDDRDDESIVWRRTFPLEHGVGPGSSPLVRDGLLILIQDGMDRQYVLGLDKSTGATVWQTDRPPMDAPSGDMMKSYCTPIAVTDSRGRDQLICMGAQWMVAYSPKTGDEIWRVRHGTGFSVVPRPVHIDGVVYFCTGYGKPQLWAVRIDGSGDVTDSHVDWTVKTGIPAKPSPILHDGLIYVVSDNGVASCIDAADGDLVWKERIGGDYSASPVLVGEHLFFGSQDGKVTVMTLGRHADVVAVNQFSGKIMASPAIVDDAMILRTDTSLYRIEN